MGQSQELECFLHFPMFSFQRRVFLGAGEGMIKSGNSHWEISFYLCTDLHLLMLCFYFCFFCPFNESSYHSSEMTISSTKRRLVLFEIRKICGTMSILIFKERHTHVHAHL